MLGRKERGNEIAKAYGGKVKLHREAEGGEVKGGEEVSIKYGLLMFSQQIYLTVHFSFSF
jgi:hypothetical protein